MGMSESVGRRVCEKRWMCECVGLYLCMYVSVTTVVLFYFSLRILHLVEFDKLKSPPQVAFNSFN